jgi:hypothetical protein
MAAPGASSPTLEFVLGVETLERWRDTTYSGFATASDGAFLTLADTPEFDARILGVFPVPDTVRTFGDTLPAET